MKPLQATNKPRCTEREKRLTDQLAIVKRKITEAEASPIPPDLSQPENPS